MATDQKISTLIEQQFPDFVRDDGPKLVAFAKAYYEFMEQSNNAIEVTKNLLNYQDIDNTYDKYLDYFYKEILSTIPKNIIADRKLLAKHVHSLHRSRGSELSYKLLFRILFNEEIEFYYPGRDILRASDGRWNLETAIRVSEPTTGSKDDIEGRPLVGLTSGATARIDRIETVNEGGIIVDELYVVNISGTFIDGEVINVDNGVFTGTIFGLSGPLQEVEIFNGGAFHQSGDSVRFTSASGSGASGLIVATDDTSAVQWLVANGGSGYTTNASITIIDNGGFNTSFRITGITAPEVIPDVNDDIIEPMKNVVLNTGPLFVSAGANTATVSANLALANVSTVLNAGLSFSNLQVGTIATVETTNFGYGYTTLPVASVIESRVASLKIDDGAGGIKGDNATIVAENVPGSITDVSVNVFGSGYNKFNPVTIENESRTGTSDGGGNPVVSGIVEFPGVYTDTKGFLSWNNKLQDNDYFQEYSYVISSDNFMDAYRKVVNATLHPAGTKMFGRVRISDTQSLTLSAQTSISVGGITIKSYDTISDKPTITDATIV